MKWEFAGQLRPEAGLRYRQHEFDLPPGVGRLSIRVCYAPPAKTYPSLLVFDPHGWRGEAKSYGRRGPVELALEFGDRTSPSAVPGPLPPGAWAVQLNAIYGSAPVDYQATVEAAAEDEARPAAGAAEPFFPALARAFAPRAGWYRGDLHLHSSFSDGWYTPRELADMAVREGVDFFAVTDHNAIGAYRTFAAISDVLAIPGIEVSFPEGHANIFGLQGWLDWRVGWAGLTMDEALRRARRQGLVVSVNHPTLEPWEWRVADTPLELLDCLEVCNDPSYPANDHANLEALALWSACLNAGHRLVALGGSDAFHHPPGQSYRGIPERLAQPSTYVWASELSGQAILDSVRAGRVYVTQGPRLTFRAIAGGRVLEIGDEAAPSAQPLQLTAEACCLAPDHALNLIRCGRPVSHAATGAAEATLAYTAPAPDPAGTWYRLDVLDGDGRLIATTNPIFVGPSQPRPATFGEMLQAARQEAAAARAANV